MSENPFEDPKQEPSGGQYQSTRGGVRTEGLDSYNPFEDGPSGEPSGAAAQQPPSYAPSSASWAADTAELDRRQRDLEAKAAELERREEEARKREEEARRESGRFTDKNWPPLPSFCPFGPCFYQDIDVEIPAEFRSMVRVGYYVWMAHAVILAINVIGALAFFAANIQAGSTSDRTSSSATTFGLSILFLLLFTPASYVCWFRPLYKAFRSDSSFNFMLFFFIFLAQCAVVIIQAIGLNWFASCGWINALSMIKTNLPAAILMMLVASLFSLLAVVDVFMLIKVHRIYRGSGASFVKARQEFTEGVAANETMRSAAADIGAAAARGAMSGR